MTRTEEDYNEWLQELREEALAEDRHEYNMRNDYEYFLYQYDSELGDIQDLISYIRKAHETYGWEFDLSDLI